VVAEHSGFNRAVKGMIGLGTAERGSVVHAVKAVSQRQTIPQVRGPFMLLDCRQMECEACLSQALKLCQLMRIDLRVVLEPVFDQGSWRDQGRNFGESECQAVSQTSTSVHNVIPMATKKSIMQQGRRDAEVVLEIGRPAYYR
jgi:hypothetical protein